MTATGEEAGFIRSICERPEDDTPRLVYADWLQERGEDDRAEFIRAQVSLGPGYDADRCHCGRTDCERCPLQWREAKLLDAHPEWLRVPCRACDGVRKSAGHPPRCGACNDTGDAGGLAPWPREPGKPNDYPYRTAFRRGFADVVAGPRLRDVLRHECPACGGYDDVHCEILCDGDFVLRPTPWATRVVTSHPTVTRFRLSDKQPGCHRGGVGDRAGYWWEPGLRFDGPHLVPFWLGEVGVECGLWSAGFHGGLMVYVPPNGRPRDRGWESAEAAQDALAAVVCRAVRTLLAEPEVV